MVSVGVVGLGAMGLNHVRTLKSMDEVDFIFAFDPDPAVVEPSGVERLKSLSDLVETDLAYCVLASPSSQHLEGAAVLIGAKMNVLIEKPVADSLSNAKAIEELSLREPESAVRVGHVERFNPSIVEMWKRVSKGEIGELYAISTVRRGPPPNRYIDTGVSLDLGVHDFDLARCISASDYKWVRASSRMRTDHESEGLIRVIGELESGVVIDHAIDWQTPQKMRQVSVLGSEGMLIADLLTADLTLFSPANLELEWQNLALLRGGSQGAVTRYAFPKVEPIRSQHLAFMSLLSDETVGNLATVQDGVRAVEISGMVTSSRTP